MLAENVLCHVVLFLCGVSAQYSSSSLPGRRYFHSCKATGVPYSMVADNRTKLWSPAITFISMAVR